MKPIPLLPPSWRADLWIAVSDGPDDVLTLTRWHRPEPAHRHAVATGGYVLSPRVSK